MKIDCYSHMFPMAYFNESATLKNFIPGYELPISRPPSEYFKLMYMDTVSQHQLAYICAHSTSGADKILLGSDYPYSRWKDTVKVIEELDIPVSDKEKIYSENVRRLLKIT